LNWGLTYDGKTVILSSVINHHMTHTFDQLKSAIEGQTPCQLIKTRDEDGYRTYTLLDGCGDAMGDAFPDLEEVYFYVSNNDQVREELQCDS
jgi:hypothetical protein